MEISKILSADILDLLFDNRNKDYGAYELRKTYQQRVVRSLLLTVAIAGLVFAGSALARLTKAGNSDRVRIKIVEIQPLTDPKKQEKPPEPEKKPEPPKIRTEAFIDPKITEDDKVKQPLATQDDLDSAKIGLIKTNGDSYKGTDDNIKIDDGKGIIEESRNTKPDEPFTTVEIDAKFSGNWVNFLQRNLRPDVPVENGAPAGSYKIFIQFVVDVDGSVSDIKPLTHIGYGMEEEAVRVLKKATKWEPAFQNGIHVKSYRRQPITFEVAEE
jgi:protein TonB